MPYKRRYQRRRRPIARQSGGYLDTASKALAVAYAVKKLVNVEYFSVATIFTADPNTTTVVQNLTAIAQGDDQDERQGNKIRAKRIVCSGVVELNSSATDSRVRMVIARDNNGSTTIPGIAQLFTDDAAFRDGRPKLGSAQSNSRFSVLMDKMVIVNSDTPTKLYSWSMTLDHHIFYAGTAATDEGKGQLYLFIASNEATNDPVVSITSRVWYIDN